MQHSAARWGILVALLCLVLPVRTAATDTETVPKFLHLEDAVRLAIYENPKIAVADARRPHTEVQPGSAGTDRDGVLATCVISHSVLESFCLWAHAQPGGF